jgi:hypothetical protein
MNPEDLLGQQPPDALDPSMMQEETPHSSGRSQQT